MNKRNVLIYGTIYVVIIGISMLYVFFIYSQKYKENFITWFLPYYNKSTGELTEFTPPYITSNLELNYLEHKTFDNLTINVKAMNTYYDFLFKNILKSLRINKLIINDMKDTLEEVSKNPLHTGIFSAPFIVNNINKNISVFFLINLSDKWEDPDIRCISNKDDFLDIVLKLKKHLKVWPMWVSHIMVKKIGKE